MLSFGCFGQLPAEVGAIEEEVVGGDPELEALAPLPLPVTRVSNRYAEVQV